MFLTLNVKERMKVEMICEFPAFLFNSLQAATLETLGRMERSRASVCVTEGVSMNRYKYTSEHFSISILSVPLSNFLLSDCYGKNFGPKGFGFGMSSATLNTGDYAPDS